MAWATRIVNESHDLHQLSTLLLEDYSIATRFSWLLSDVAAVDPGYLFAALPHLFSIREHPTQFNFTTSFATYWQLCGIPEKQEGEAVELLFEWLQTREVNVTTKSRDLKALLPLTEKYPDLKSELKLVLEEVKGLSSKEFEKRANKVLRDL